MARVGVGVPVYNGGALLRQSLECLRTQTFEDIEVQIGDNASTDETAEICAEFAARDSRFHHIRRPANIESLPNFVDLRRRSSAELFMWRAHDDLSDANFVEALVGCFERDPSARLAVCNVRSAADDRAPRDYRYRRAPAVPRIGGVLHRMFTCHASWIYGLWHRETLAGLQDRVHSAYSHAWGWDHLCLLPLLLDARVSGTRDTVFLQRILRNGTTRAERRAKRPGVAALRALRDDFARVCRDEVDRRDWNPFERLVLGAALPFYVDRRGYSRLKLFRRSVREGDDGPAI